MRICPICGKGYDTYPAISRTDNKTEICPRCGEIEAINAAPLSEKQKETILNVYDLTQTPEFRNMLFPRKHE